MQIPLEEIQVPTPGLSSQKPPSANDDLIASIERKYLMATQWILSLMEDIAEAERRDIFLDERLSSTADWLCARLGLGYKRAEELVNVSICLVELPKLKDAYREGVLSYDHLRALIKVAGPDSEESLIEECRGRSVAFAWDLVAKIQSVSAEDSVIARSQRWLEMRQDKDNRSMHMFGVFPEELGKTVEKAIDALAKKMPSDPGPLDPEWMKKLPMGTRRADALAAMASSALSNEPARAQVMVHLEVSGKGAAQIEGGPQISLETARRLSCDSVTRWVTHAPDGRPIDSSRAQRCATPKQRSELNRRQNGTCGVAGCRMRKGLQAHHIDGWPSPTELDNLILLCSAHHYLVEEAGYKIRGEHPKMWIERPNRAPMKMGPPRLTARVQAKFAGEFAEVMTRIGGPG